MEKDNSNDVNIIGGNGITAGRDVFLHNIKAPVNIGNTNNTTQNYIYISENIEEYTKSLIDFAQFCEKKREYEKSLEYYEQARVKLERNESKILLVKVMIGEAVCHHKKGNLSRAKDLIYEAESLDPKNPTVLANIASQLKSENPDEAEIYAKKALEFDKNNFLAKCVIGLLEYEKGDTINSLRILRQASTITSNVGYPSCCMARIYSYEKDYENAIQYGKEAVKVEPENVIFHMELAIDYMNAAFAENEVCISSDFSKTLNMEYVEKALECLEKAKELSEEQGNNYLNCEIYTHLSRVHLAKGEFIKSIEYCEMAFNGGLDTIDLYVILGEAYGGCQDSDKVIEYYEPLVEREDLTGNHLFIVKANLATAYSIKNRLNEAEKLFKELIDENPENINLYIQLSNVLEENGKVEKAYSLLEKIDMFPQKPWDFYYMMGRLYHKKDDYENSVKYFKEAISKNSEAIPPRIYLINLYLECGMHEYAVKQAIELVQLAPIGINFYKLASLYYEIGNYKESAVFSRKALEADYDKVETYRLLCSSLLQANKLSEAKDEFENAFTKYPDDLELKLNYSATLSTLEYTEKAIEVLNQVISDNPNFVFAYKALAHIYYKEASYEKALEYSKKVIFIEPEDEDAHFVMGCSLLNLGKIDEAVKEIQKVIEINPNFDSAWLVDAEKGMEYLGNLITISNHTLERYEDGNITISKASELLKRNTFDLLCHINNVKVAESLSLSDEKIDQLRNSPISKRDVLVDETMLGILAKIGCLDLLRLAFDHVYIIKELEDKIIIGPYLKDHPYRDVKNKLQIIDGGWIKSLNPNDMIALATKKIVFENKFSKNDISFIALALDKDLLCLTEDLLLRVQLESINKSTCGIFGLIDYLVSKSIIKIDDAKEILTKVKSVCIVE
ncbi:tetratricopeptide repeat protein [Methanosarcina soligelidi]|uniref:tetratricopeptide repeat protein n=1 Tax=Methanosarcina soligelidi TaxID=1036677 RepID=UPI00064EF401|nr:tetratricopeptide repeat protein [Methanosarcina soligelidi]